ncbi:MAG TPA: TonB-dependent receptor [Acidobacteriaceae bacterium]|jgi:hypothetical protein|nr:TonB-dependent receptor [Acidobacteriaceae bacterium]
MTLKRFLRYACPRRVFVAAALFALGGCLWLASPAANGQVTGQATLSGVVTDPAGAVVVGAQITITNTATNVAQSSVTNSTGYYEIDGLNPGPYEIRVSAPGFSNLLRQGITLNADARLNVPLKLSAGGGVATVTVTADASLLNTESGSEGQVLTTQQLQSLPVSGANTFQFMEIAPGVQSENSQTYSMDGTLMWNGVSNFGTAGVIGQNEYSLDGAPNEGNQQGNAISLAVDEVGEQKMDVSGFDASVGHTDGIAITQTTKSGTNDLHGTLRGLYQDRRWAAMQHFQGLNYRYQQQINGCKGPGTSPECFIIENRFGQPGVHENNDGFGIGGPVFLPKIYDGRNKFFWFTGYDNDIFTDSSAQTISLPTLQERTGNFNDLPVPNPVQPWPTAVAASCPAGTPYYGQYQLYNPYSVALTGKNNAPQRQPFCGNVIPASLMPNNAMVKLYNSLIPTPTNSLTTGSNYQYTNPQPQTFRQFTQRFDYAVSSKDHAFFRWSRAHYTKAGTGFTIGDVDIQQGPRWIDTGAFGWNHVFSSSTNLDVTVGATQYKTQCCYYPGYQQYTPGDLGLPSYMDTYAGSQASLPILSISNYQGIGNNNNPPAYYRTLAVRSNLTHVQGHHTIRAGGEWRQQNFAQASQGDVFGQFNFDDTYTQENNGTDSNFTQSNWGLSYAAFLMGIPTSSSVSYTAGKSVSTPYFAFYGGDTWRVTPRLTIIPGLRFEYEFGPVEKHNAQMVGWDFNTTLPTISGPANTAYQGVYAGATAAQKAAMPTSLTIQGGPQYAGVNGAPLNEFQNSYRFLPRIALAYQVRQDTVIRAGYGLFFDTLDALEEGGSPASGAPGTPGSLMKTDFTTNQAGFSTSTSVPTSTTYGTNFVASQSLLANPFPANASGQRFNQPIGSAAGSLYYVGQGATLYDHNLVPPREQRAEVSVQHQFGASTMLEVAFEQAYVSDVPISKSYSFTPAQFYAPFQGMQPNTASAQILGSKVNNPFLLANFGGVASSNPAAYNLMSLNSFFTQSQTTVGSLVHANPQQSGLSIYRSIGQSKFRELQVNVNRRYSHGLTFMGAFQWNSQRDLDWFRNGFDATPNWELSNNSVPFRFTAEGIYQLPLGRGKAWATSGWQNAIFGGFQVNTTYEVAPGAMIQFGSEWYVGAINANNIQSKHPLMVNGIFAGGHNYIQWLNVGNITTTYNSTTGACSYNGTKGFVTLSNCQPNYNLTQFPPFISGVRAKGPDQVQLGVQRTFHVKDRVDFETRAEAYNLFNRQVFSAFPDTGPTDSTFGQITGDGAANGSGNARWMDIQGKIRF